MKKNNNDKKSLHIIAAILTWFLLAFLLIMATQFTGDPDEKVLFATLPFAIYLYGTLYLLATGKVELRFQEVGQRLRASSSQQPPTEPHLTHYERQLLDIQQAPYVRKQCLFNEREEPVYNEIIRRLAAAPRRDLVVHGQVSLGEVLTTPDPAYKAINSKRVDFLVTDRFGNIKFAVEHHGPLNETKEKDRQRNEVKIAALARAGIPLIVTESADFDAVSGIIDQAIANLSIGAQS